ncbi:simple sugar transport system permease protein [Paenibacillus phyllosphaerae]|uniref:Simple sugar transport system permease protein n=1 Tax=Paenibacillus phyllosphaerae TaxID=274593 RepID=A0A7W5B320_9BACL|nr:ABC transporter permease [Paenibacillus phyllosphaerae]MBB3113523.1 simple sugar transport system permease protein [Paenibacillus phyllosphaerae]
MDTLLDWSLLSSTLRTVAPLLLAALGGALCARVGIFNVALEGMMLTGAFTAILGNYLFGNVLLAILFACVCVGVLALLFGYLSIQLQANAIVVGTAMNFLATGLTAFSLFAIFGVKGQYYDQTMKGLPKWDIPLIKDIPVVGDVLSGHTPLVYLAFVLAAGLQYLMFRTVMGFRLMAVGENITAAKSLGIRVRRYQYGAVLASGILCALAGAQLSLGQVTLFAENMTAGRGFIALVATMLGQSSPLGVTASSLLFGFMDAISIRLQGFSLPTHFTMMLPYVITIVVMLFFKDKSYLRQSGRMDSK